MGGGSFGHVGGTVCLLLCPRNMAVVCKGDGVSSQESGSPPPNCQFTALILSLHPSQRHIWSGYFVLSELVSYVGSLSC